MKTGMQRTVNSGLTAGLVFFLFLFPSFLWAAVSNGDVECQNLAADHGEYAGEVCVTVQGHFLSVTYTTKRDWKLVKAYGLDMTDMTRSRHSVPENITGAAAYSVTLPLDTSYSAKKLRDIAADLSRHAIVRSSAQNKFAHIERRCPLR